MADLPTYRGEFDSHGTIIFSCICKDGKLDINLIYCTIDYYNLSSGKGISYLRE
jgi:hypothetical protein